MDVALMARSVAKLLEPVGGVLVVRLLNPSRA